MHVRVWAKRGERSATRCGLAMAVAGTSSSVDLQGSSSLPDSSEDEEASTVTAVSLLDVLKAPPVSVKSPA